MESSPECKELFIQRNPLKCCKLVIPIASREVQNKCFEKCADKEFARCCFVSCELEQMEIYVNDKFFSEKILENIRFDKHDDSGIEAWKPVVKEALEECLKISSVHNYYAFV